MYKICFYVPEAALEKVKSAMFDAGAGKIGEYDSCCWQVKGRGQFRPLAGSHPALGVRGQLETLDEWKVELVCEDTLVKPVISALKSAHPFEEVAYDVMRIVDVDALQGS